jgi:hypothetical protein
MRAKNIEAAVYYESPLHLLPLYRDRSSSRRSLPETEKACRQVYSIPVHPKLSENELDYIFDVEAPCSQETFFRYVAQTPGPARLLLYSCYNLSLMLFEPPLWMIQELRRLNFALPSGEIK